MRVFIAILLLFSCYASSLFAYEAKTCSTTKKAEKRLINFSKKQKNSLKTELFSNQFDFLHLSSQNHSAFAAHFNKFSQKASTFSVKNDFDYALNTTFYYPFIFQYLYPKHSFW